MPPAVHNVGFWCESRHCAYYDSFPAANQLGNHFWMRHLICLWCHLRNASNLHLLGKLEKGEFCGCPHSDPHLIFIRAVGRPESLTENVKTNWLISYLLPSQFHFNTVQNTAWFSFESSLMSSSEKFVENMITIKLIGCCVDVMGS